MLVVWEPKKEKSIMQFALKPETAFDALVSDNKRLREDLSDLRDENEEIIHFLRLLLDGSDIDPEMKHAIGSYIRDHDEEKGISCEQS